MKRILIAAFTLIALTSFSQKEIKPEEAAKHVDDSVSVCGKVFGGVYLQKSKGTPTMLSMGAAYPDNPFTVVIFDKARVMFKDAPEVLYKDSHVCVTGRVALFNGKPQIVVNNPKQINPIN